MSYLFLVSLIWAFSFGLIGNRLAGIDPNGVAFVRLGLAALCFLPWLRIGALPRRRSLELVALGGLQFGVMYVAYIRAYAYLPSHLVALFTVFTPVYITLAEDLLDRTVRSRFWLCAGLAVAGALVLRGTVPEGSFWRGFALVQLANLSFGLGQVGYRRWRRLWPTGRDHRWMVLPYFGGALVAGAFFALGTPAGFFTSLSAEQWATLGYLGLVASGVGFWLWNRGATLVSAGTLAAFNNAVIPLAVVVSLFGFGEAQSLDGAELGRLVAGAVLIFSGILLGRVAAPPPLEPRT